MRMSMKIRVHEWMADRFSWVQYPDLRREAMKQRHPRPTLMWHYKRLTWKQLGWICFFIFWACIGLMASIGPGAQSGV